MEDGQVDRFDDTHIVKGYVQIVMCQFLEFAATKPRATDRGKAFPIRPFHGAKHIGTVSGSADGNQQVSRAGEVLELFDKDAIKSLVICPGQNVGRVVGQTEDLQSLLLVIFKVLAPERPLAEVLTKWDALEPLPPLPQMKTNRSC